MRRLGILLILLVVGVGTVILALGGQAARSVAEDVSVGGALARTEASASGAEENAALQRVSVEALARQRGLDPWPGLRGNWMYRCAVELQPQGAVNAEELRIRVDGPGLPHRGWTGALDETGTLLVPELAIGSEYSFTILSDARLLPAYGLDSRGADRFHLEPYAAAGPQGELGVMRVEFRLVAADARVRLTDERGAAVHHVVVAALQSERSPARLLGGEWRWSADDGTIPLPIPDGYQEYEPFLRVIEPPGEFLDQPLSAGLIAAAAQSGSLPIERTAPGSRVRFEAVHRDGRPALMSVVFDAAGKRELARPDWSGRFDFITRERKFLIRTPEYPDAVGLFSILANDAPDLEEWPQVLVTKPGVIKIRIEGLADAACWPAQLAVETTDAGSVEILGSRSRQFLFGEDRSIHLARFSGSPHLRLTSSAEHELHLRLYWWGRLADEREVQLTPEQEQEIVFQATVTPGTPLRLSVSDAQGKPVRRARISLRHPAPEDFGGSGSTSFFESIGMTDAHGGFVLPPVPPETAAELEITAALSPALILPLREVQARAGVIVLPVPDAAGPGGNKHE